MFNTNKITIQLSLLVCFDREQVVFFKECIIEIITPFASVITFNFLQIFQEE